MAIILGSKPVNDLEQFNDTAIGVVFPLQFGNNTFVQSFKTDDQIKTNIKSLLLTKQYERVMQPNLNSKLNELVFDFNDERLASDVEDAITEALEPWLPFITVDQIDIFQPNDLKDRYTVEISIKYRISGGVELNELTFTL